MSRSAANKLNGQSSLINKDMHNNFLNPSVFLMKLPTASCSSSVKKKISIPETGLAHKINDFKVKDLKVKLKRLNMGMLSKANAKHSNNVCISSNKNHTARKLKDNAILTTKKSCNNRETLAKSPRIFLERISVITELNKLKRKYNGVSTSDYNSKLECSVKQKTDLTLKKKRLSTYNDCDRTINSHVCQIQNDSKIMVSSNNNLTEKICIELKTASDSNKIEATMKDNFAKDMINKSDLIFKISTDENCEKYCTNKKSKDKIGNDKDTDEQLNITGSIGPINEDLNDNEEETTPLDAVSASDDDFEMNIETIKEEMSSDSECDEIMITTCEVLKENLVNKFTNIPLRCNVNVQSQDDDFFMDSFEELEPIYKVIQSSCSTEDSLENVQEDIELNKDLGSTNKECYDSHNELEHNEPDLQPITNLQEQDSKSCNHQTEVITARNDIIEKLEDTTKQLDEIDEVSQQSLCMENTSKTSDNVSIVQQTNEYLNRNNKHSESNVHDAETEICSENCVENLENLQTNNLLIQDFSLSIAAEVEIQNECMEFDENVVENERILSYVENVLLQENSMGENSETLLEYPLDLNYEMIHRSLTQESSERNKGIDNQIIVPCNVKNDISFQKDSTSENNTILLEIEKEIESSKKTFEKNFIQEKSDIYMDIENEVIDISDISTQKNLIHENLQNLKRDSNAKTKTIKSHEEKELLQKNSETHCTNEDSDSNVHRENHVSSYKNLIHKIPEKDLVIENELVKESEVNSLFLQDNLTSHNRNIYLEIQNGIGKGVAENEKLLQQNSIQYNSETQFDINSESIATYQETNSLIKENLILQNFTIASEIENLVTESSIMVQANLIPDKSEINPTIEHAPVKICNTNSLTQNVISVQEDPEIRLGIVNDVDLLQENPNSENSELNLSKLNSDIANELLDTNNEDSNAQIRDELQTAKDDSKIASESCEFLTTSEDHFEKFAALHYQNVQNEIESHKSQNVRKTNKTVPKNETVSTREKYKKRKRGRPKKSVLMKESESFLDINKGGKNCFDIQFSKLLKSADSCTLFQKKISKMHNSKKVQKTKKSMLDLEEIYSFVDNRANEMIKSPDNNTSFEVQQRRKSVLLEETESFLDSQTNEIIKSPDKNTIFQVQQMGKSMLTEVTDSFLDSQTKELTGKLPEYSTSFQEQQVQKSVVMEETESFMDSQTNEILKSADNCTPFQENNKCEKTNAPISEKEPLEKSESCEKPSDQFQNQIDPMNTFENETALLQKEPRVTETQIEDETVSQELLKNNEFCSGSQDQTNIDIIDKSESTPKSNLSVEQQMTKENDLGNGLHEYSNLHRSMEDDEENLQESLPIQENTGTKEKLFHTKKTENNIDKLVQNEEMLSNKNLVSEEKNLVDNHNGKNEESLEDNKGQSISNEPIKDQSDVEPIKNQSEIVPVKNQNDIGVLTDNAISTQESQTSTELTSLYQQIDQETPGNEISQETIYQATEEQEINSYAKSVEVDADTTNISTYESTSLKETIIQITEHVDEDTTNVHASISSHESTSSEETILKITKDIGEDTTNIHDSTSSHESTSSKETIHSISSHESTSSKETILQITEDNVEVRMETTNSSIITEKDLKSQNVIDVPEKKNNKEEKRVIVDDTDRRVKTHQHSPELRDCLKSQADAIDLEDDQISSKENAMLEETLLEKYKEADTNVEIKKNGIRAKSIELLNGQTCTVDLSKDPSINLTNSKEHKHIKIQDRDIFVKTGESFKCDEESDDESAGSLKIDTDDSDSASNYRFPKPNIHEVYLEEDYEFINSDSEQPQFDSLSLHDSCESNVESKNHDIFAEISEDFRNSELAVNRENENDSLEDFPVSNIEENVHDDVGDIHSYGGAKMKIFVDICMKCNEVQPRLNDKLVSNCLKCNTDTIFRCLLCKRQYKNPSGMYNHILKFHDSVRNPMRPVRCIRCYNIFKSRYHVRQHLRLCKVAACLKCPYCIEKLKRRDSLRKHIFRYHSEDFERENLENILDKVVLEAKGMRQKAMKFAETVYGGVTSYEPNAFSLIDRIWQYCPNCNVTHKGETRSERKNCTTCRTKLQFECRKCGKRYNNRYGITIHLKDACETLEKSIFNCNSCAFTASSKILVKEHIRNFHCDQVDFCQDCELTFPSQETLVQHMKICHSNQLQHNCILCSFKSATPIELRAHVQQMHPSSFGVNEKRFVYFSDPPEEPPSLPPPAPEVKMEDGVTAVAELTDVKEELIDQNFHHSEHLSDHPTVHRNIEEDQRLNKKHFVMKMLCTFCCFCNQRGRAVELVTKCSICSTRLIYFCRVCRTEKRKFAAARIHVMRNHMERTYHCDNTNCNRSFSYQYDYKQHRKRCISKPHLRCPNCGFLTKYKRTFNNHRSFGKCFRKMHLQKAYNREAYVPPYMELKRKVFTPIKMKKLLLRKTNTCCRCATTFNSKDELARHSKHCVLTVKMFSCEHCQFRTPSKKVLEDHIMSKHAARLFRSVEAFSCEICSKVFKNYFVYYRHSENCHLRSRKHNFGY